MVPPLDNRLPEFNGIFALIRILEFRSLGSGAITHTYSRGSPAKEISISLSLPGSKYFDFVTLKSFILTLRC